MKFVPHPYQAYCIERVLSDEKLGLMLDMGLGKTVIALTAVNELIYNRLEVSKVLVIAPKKVAEGTWTTEAAKWDHLNLLRFSKVMGTAAQRERALYTPADVYVINRDNVRWLAEYFKGDWPFDMVICDEFSSFKNSRSKRFAALRRMLPGIRRLVGLTGTPAPNGWEDLWAQIYLPDGGQRLGRTLTSYRDQFFDHNPYTHSYKAKKGSDSIVHEAIQDICVSMSAEDYLALPECITADVPVVLDPAAQQAYTTMEKEMLLEVDSEVIEATSAVALSNKLRQLCNGSVYDEGGEAVKVHRCKLDVLTETVEALNGQHALLFYAFRHDIPSIKAALKKLGGLRVRELKTPEDEQAWNRGEVDILLAHPASAAYGLNLQDGGHHVVWFGLPWSLELYLQANKRLHRQGQQNRVIVHRLVVQGGVDEDTVKALENKGDTQEALLTAIKARIERVQNQSGGQS